jgi:hypothetical protein
MHNKLLENGPQTGRRHIECKNWAECDFRINYPGWASVKGSPDTLSITATAFRRSGMTMIAKHPTGRRGTKYGRIKPLFLELLLQFRLGVGEATRVIHPEQPGCWRLCLPACFAAHVPRSLYPA